MDLLIEQLQKNYIHFKEIPHWSIYFRKRWEHAFVHHLNDSEKENNSSIWGSLLLWLSMACF